MSENDSVYVVVSLPNSRDTSMALTAIRIITKSAVRAIVTARKAMMDRTSVYVNCLHIYRIKPEEVYNLEHYTRDRGSLDTHNPNLIYIGRGDCESQSELFRGDFPKYPKLTPHPKDKIVASPGKVFVLAVHGNQLYKFGDEVGTEAEAIELYSKEWPELFIIAFDDQGKEVREAKESSERHRQKFRLAMPDRLYV